jgi:hypothetical protein
MGLECLKKPFLRVVNLDVASSGSESRLDGRRDGGAREGAWTGDGRFRGGDKGETEAGMTGGESREA